MNALRTTVLFVIALLPATGSGGDVERGRLFETVSPAELIVGKWVATRADEDTLPKDAVVEFLRDGRMLITMGIGNEKMHFQCTYKIGPASFTIISTLGEQEQRQKINIKSLTPTTLSTTDEKGKVVVLRRTR